MDIKKIVGTVTLVVGTAEKITPLAEKINDNIIAKTKELKDGRVKIPEILKKRFPIDIDQATDILETSGLKILKSELPLSNADPKYKDYIENQIIDIHPKQGAYVNIGSIVCVRYIPINVVEESQRIFNESERQKLELIEKRKRSRKEAGENVKDNIATMGNKTKDSLKNIFIKRNKSDEV